MKKRFHDHQYFHIDESCSKSTASTAERQLCVVRKALINPYGERRKVAIDGMHLDISQRKRIMEYVRDCGATVHYVFFEKSLKDIRQYNQQSAQPMSEQQLQEGYDQLYFPHPWEAHSLEVVA